ncbi:SDR family NAD(P)-dependent oxidoreductase [Falsiroseomonas tokyonensis]|uniref:SDR family NAD(P)-dependent oxidoreductase n=1 Tax=Falsiroseomonas tokyonensis TaxID=430521 RepID=A0ABV7BUE1_9PROT|nr:SDR family NAD(P)-dependent oxidoreductase [Falsiroseomonas tokyonensis]MBU8537771.1 SDR family oxidoreductase [Falsiroseomonas tokyonensis]
MSGQLDGQVAVITGGSRGIGRAIALLFAREGADIAFCHLNDAEGAAPVVAQIEALGRRAFAASVDVADLPALRAFIAQSEQKLGPCDILVNNAGLNIRGAIETITEEMYDRVLDVHVKASFFAAQAVWAGMAARGRGRIITTASQLGLKGAPNIVPYCTAKAALIGMTRALGHEGAPKGILVNAIAPGPVATDLTAQLGPEWAANIGAKLPIGRVGQPEEIAAAALLLASSPGGDFFVGATLSPNGGDIMH